MNVTISTVNYEVTVANADNFYKIFNLTDRSLNSLMGTGCFVNNYNGAPDYSSSAINLSSAIYIVFALLTMSNRSLTQSFLLSLSSSNWASLISLRPSTT